MGQTVMVNGDKVRAKPESVAFFGLFGQQNLGNECTLQTIIYNTRRYLPDAELKCICTGPADTSIRYNIPAFSWEATGSEVWQGRNNALIRLLRKVFVRIPMELLHWVKAFRILKGTQMLIVPGSGLLSDYPTHPYPLGRPYEIFKWSAIARLCRCKLLFVSVGAGPIYHPLSKWFIKSALRLADYRSYRDNYSKEYIASIGFETKDDPVYPDLVFSFPKSLMPEGSPREGQRLIVGVGVMDYFGELGSALGAGESVYHDFIGKLAVFVTWLLEHKYTVRILIGDALYDARVRQEVAGLVGKARLEQGDRQIITDPILSVEQLLSQLAATDFVVSPRFHNILLALMLNKPVISLSYHEKNTSLVRGVGLERYWQQIDHLDVDRLVEQLVDLGKNASSLTPYIKQRAECYRESLDEQYTFIFNDMWTTRRRS